MTTNAGLETALFTTGATWAAFRLADGSSAVLNGSGAGNTLYVVYDIRLASNVGQNTTILNGGASTYATLTNWTDSSTSTVNLAAASGGYTPPAAATINDGATLKTADYSTGELAIVAASENTVASPLIGTAKSLTGAPVGDIVRYRAYVAIPEGVSDNLALTVALPTGVQYLGGATVGSGRAFREI